MKRFSLLALFLAASFLGVSSPSASGQSPIFFGKLKTGGQRANGLDATKLYQAVPEGEREQAKQCVSRLAANVIGMIEGDARFRHFARPVEVFSELPDDVLLLVVSVEAADELTYASDRYGQFTSLLLAVSLQLADPRTGQVVYSDFDVVDGLSDFDKDGRGRWEPGYRPGERLENRALWPVAKVDRVATYCSMLDSLVRRMASECLGTSQNQLNP